MIKFISVLCIAFLLTGCATTESPSVTKGSEMITHTVFFKLNHVRGSEAEALFLSKAAALSAIPGVENFQILEETSPKNSFDFGLSMEFADQAAYDTYNTHPEHIAFVQQAWLNEVADFQEIDYIPLTNLISY
ncbi:Dabb family protein [Pontiellaceae bacterium B1224]|nr:Dabb family protein [Pontiellaceae bacterium B1224]